MPTPAVRYGRTGLFNPAAVGQLVKKAREGGTLGETDDMALVGIMSTQLVHHHFVKSFRRPEPLGANDRVKVCRITPQTRLITHEVH